MSDPPLPPVRFNHLYVVLDEKTYRAVISSDFLRLAFPGMEQRSTLTGAGETWAGTYYYCRETYLEFFGAAGHGHWHPGAQEGWSGLAFGTDQPGGVTAVRDALQKAFHYEPHSELRQVNTGEKTINWFYNLSLAERLSLGSFDAWLMEYHPDIFAYKDIPIPRSGTLTTEAYLSQWNQERNPPPPAEKNPLASTEMHASKVKEGKVPVSKQPPVPAPVFSAVIGATVHLDVPRAERFAETLTFLGWTRSTDDDQLLLSSPDFTLHICPETSAPAGYRLSSLRLAMSRPSVAPMTFVFAPRSRLVLHEDQTADWFFGQ